MKVIIESHCQVLVKILASADDDRSKIASILRDVSSAGILLLFIVVLFVCC